MSIYHSDDQPHPPGPGRRVSLDFGGAQTGDISAGNISGGDQISGSSISVNDPGIWLEFVRDYLWTTDQARTKRDDELAAELVAARRELLDLGREFTIYQAGMRNHLDALRQQQQAALQQLADRARINRLLAVAALLLAAVAVASGFL